MTRIIIENRSNLDDATGLEVAQRVVQQGRISNSGKQYCYATRVTVEGAEYMVFSDLNKASDRLVITNAQTPRKESK